MSAEIHSWYDNLEAAIAGTTAPEAVIGRLALVPVDFLNLDGERKVGQLVIASAHASDIQEIFGRMRDGKFPIGSVVPMVHYDWVDYLSIADGEAGNSSGFNHRFVNGTNILSMHGPGWAVDLNPKRNGWYPKGKRQVPVYPYPPRNIKLPGTIVEGGVVTRRAFDDYGWSWGGRWADGPDYQHFEKPAA